jgi:imidazolonepropionase-like amidohydrolase
MTRTVLTHVNLIDGKGPARPDCTVVIENERISEVTAGDPGAADGQVIDLTGRTVMPGMWVCHMHVDMGARGPAGVTMAQSMRTCQTLLQSGVTGYVGAGVTYDIDAQLKMAIEQDLMDGPRIVAGSRFLSTTGHDNDMLAPWWVPRSDGGLPLVVDGPDEFRKAAREEIRRGSEIIKIFLTSGHGAEGGGRGLSSSELQAVVEAAHERGKRVRAHAIWRDDIRDAIEAGVDLIDHGDETDEEIVAMMVERGTWWVPSMALLKWLVELERGGGREYGMVLPSENAGRDWDNLCRILPLAEEAGVKIVPGDDYGVGPIPHAPGVYAKELAIYVNEVGIKPISVLGWATRNAGLLFGQEVGTVTPGSLADLLVLDGDPSNDITVLEHPDHVLKAVMVGGRFVLDRLPDR